MSSFLSVPFILFKCHFKITKLTNRPLITFLFQFSIYGFFQCVDAFLFIFTFLPLRIILAVLKIFTVPCGFMR